MTFEERPRPRLRTPVAMTRAALITDRPDGASEDVHFPASLAEAVIGQLSREGDVVLDPFAGFGTTAVVAVSMGRRAVAVELLEERAAVIRRRLESAVGQATVMVGDARELSTLVGGPIDLCLTSPPYMSEVDHPENPLTGYRTRDGDYATYLAELEDVFRQVAGLLRPGGQLVINVADVVHAGHVTPLAGELRGRVARHLAFVEDVPVSWDVLPPGVASDHLLVFERRPRRPPPGVWWRPRSDA